MGSILTSVALGWLGRRFKELGSIATVLFSLYSILPPEHQQLVWAVLTGRGGMQSIGAYAGLLWYLWTQRDSFIATVRPQVVTRDGQKIENIPARLQADIEATAAEAPPRRRTIGSVVLDGLLEKLNRNR